MASRESLEALKKAIIEGESDQAIALVKEALEDGIDPRTILNESLIKGAETVGELYQKEEYFLADLILSADAMNAVMEELKPELAKNKANYNPGTVVIGTVEGDIHSIGKNIMVFLLQGHGYKVIDLGVDVPPEKFIEAARDHNPHIIGLSGLTTMSISKMKETVLAIHETNITSDIIIGGGLLTLEIWKMVGSEGFARDAWEGLVTIEELIDEGHNTLI